MQYVCDPCSKSIARFTKTIDDLAEVSLINTKYFRHPVLAETTRIDSQL